MTTNDTHKQPGESCRIRSRRGRLGLAGAALFAAGMLAGALTTTAFDAQAHDGARSSAWYHGGERHRAHSRRGGLMSPGKLEHVLDHLDATPEQADAAREILDEAKDELRPLRERHREARAALAQALFAEPSDAAEVERLRADAVATMEDISKVMVDGVQRFAEMLDADQRARVARFVAQRHR